MGFTDAKRDGVRFVHDGTLSWFYPRCHKCGAEVENWNYISGTNYTCKACKLEEKLADVQKRVDNSVEAKEKKFNTAYQRVMDSYGLTKRKKYIEAGEIIHKKLHTPGWFDSTEEIMVAIELVRRDVRARHQVRFGTRYKADFVLPDLKIVLEVDGVCYHRKDTREKENLRDNLIVLGLGPQWEVIRITDELINENITKLVPAIKKIYEKRQEIRSKNNGQLPGWYSERN